MAKNKKGKSRPSRPPRQPKPQIGRRNGGLVDNSGPLHIYGGGTAYAPGNRVPAHGTMADEVRNTLFHRGEFVGRGDSKLRHRPIVFVCAGLMDPLKDLEVRPEKIAHKSPSLVVLDEPVISVPVTTSLSPASTEISQSPVKTSGDEPISAEQPPFFVDLIGDKSIAVAHKRGDTLNPAEDSGNDSDSSDDVILFKGRDAVRQASSRGEVAPEGTDSLNLPELTLELDQIRQDTISQNSMKPTNESQKPDPDHRTTVTSPDASSDFLAFAGANKRAQRRPSRPAMPDADMRDDEAAIIADYIANMREEDDSDEDANDTHPGLGSHAFHMLRDLGGSDSDTVPARGILAVGSSGSSDNDDDDDDDNNDDEAILRQRAEAHDAKLARLLAKQEELGLGGDDIVLFDDVDSDGEDMGGWQIAPRTTPRRKKKGSSKQARIVQKKGQYPTASKMADAFDELDLMDWHRPSLNNFKSVGKHKEPEFDVSDSDLEEAMAIAWKKDRMKKAEKKRAREELRSQGLLGKHANPEDLKIKYRGGMSIDDIEVEFEAFLMGSREQLHLPPFDKQSRQTVHLIANKFKIKSQSAGKGNTRCPVLYRTKATLPYDPDFFSKVFSRIKQSWFPRVDVDDQTVSDAKIFRARFEVGTARARKRGVVHLREGEVVGQHASELGIDNKGRAMLEKMGWSKGMALGTDDNRGIIVPITHVVKKGKAGLGDA